MEVCDHLHAPAPVPPRKHPLPYRRGGGSQSLSRPYGEQESLLAVPRIEPQILCRPARSLVAVPTELPDCNSIVTCPGFRD
jgi:hypothetical protein